MRLKHNLGIVWGLRFPGSLLLLASGFPDSWLCPGPAQESCPCCSCITPGLSQCASCPDWNLTCQPALPCITPCEQTAHVPCLPRFRASQHLADPAPHWGPSESSSPLHVIVPSHSDIYTPPHPSSKKKKITIPLPYYIPPNSPLSSEVTKIKNLCVILKFILDFSLHRCVIKIHCEFLIFMGSSVDHVLPLAHVTE